MQKSSFPDKYTVYDREGRLICRLNKETVKLQKVSTEVLNRIKELHRYQHGTKQVMKKLNPQTDIEELLLLLETWRKREFKLQELWGFDKNANFHKEWELPHCACPKIDNEDFYGNNMRYISENCPYHSTNLNKVYKNK